MRSLLSHPVGLATKKRISNYGIELEVLSRSDRRDRTPMLVDRAPSPPYLQDYILSGCDCPACNQGERNWIEDDAAYHAALAAWHLRQIDLRPVALAPTLEFLRTFRDARLTNATEAHVYHCECENCEHGRDHNPFTAQNDSTVGIEFISRILTAGDVDSINIVKRVIDAYRTGCEVTGFVAQSGASHGNHIHVSNSGLDDGGGSEFRSTTKKQVRHLLDTIMCRGNWPEIADGLVGRLRDFNSRPSKGDADGALTSHTGYESGTWIADKGYGTLEYRLWNTPRVPERIGAHVGMSVALTRWAFKQVIVNREGLNMAHVQTVTDQLVEHERDVKAVIFDCVPDEFKPHTQPLIEALQFH